MIVFFVIDRIDLLFNVFGDTKVVALCLMSPF